MTPLDQQRERERARVGGPGPTHGRWRKRRGVPCSWHGGKWGPAVGNYAGEAGTGDGQ
jgi:hypothetical protein